ncbi:putative tRNA pseudouridine synthase Pus10 [Phlebotomus argentipes]|uniref:putative tRNA pseudouridine synthase Pus10 n=1 Tax=Phlebotomus argentipes TaxID=94469 RepID=UPI002893143B|nr:putative tRNA pseudouridine synthase Pus10 [Phlebotomus argentipes]
MELSFNQKLFNFLRDEDCCLTCCLRYLKGFGSEFTDVKASLKKKGIVLPEEKEDEDSPPCSCCLGLFSEISICNATAEIYKDIQFEKFYCDKFVLSICLPVGLDVRQLIVWIKLIRHFGNAISKEERLDTSLKDTLRAIMIPVLCERLNAKYDREGVFISLHFDYGFADREAEILAKIKPQCFQSIKGNKKAKTDVNRTAVERYFVPSRLTEEEWDRILQLPAKSGWLCHTWYSGDDRNLRVREVTYTGPTIFFAGRYLKLSRELSQTPWILNDERMVLHSVQETIMASLKGNFKGGPLQMTEIPVRFSSSGREDVDVRCLGRGRPFVIEVSDCCLSELLPAWALEIQRSIAKSQTVAVTNLQIVDRSQLVHIKEGEESKRKMYRALCQLETSATLAVLQKLNICEAFTVKQFTPIRVLHRRPLIERPRVIFSVKARLSRGHDRLLVIDIQTQAGTYVKELVHGEFGRTSPSFASIIGQNIDILALDVMDIDIDWPPPVIGDLVK